jgi:replicative DNA helicase
MSEAEGGVIGAVLYDNAGWDVASQFIDANDFTHAPYRRAWEDISRLIQAGDVVDNITLGDMGHNVAMLGDLIASVSPSMAERYARMVQANTQRRSALAVLTEARTRIAHPATDVAEAIADTQGSLEGIADNRSQGYYTTDTALAAAMADIHDAAEAKRNRGLAGVPTGLKPINDATGGGWRRQMLYAIAARPSTGKTSIALHCAYHAASKGYPVGVIEIEMSASQLVQRQLSAITGVNYWDIVTGQNDADRRLAKTQLPPGVFIDDASRHVNRITARAAEWKRKHDIRLLVVDHLTLVRSDENQSRARQVGEVAFGLKELAKRLDIAVLILCQLNRESEKSDKRPLLSQLRDSGEIEEALDGALFLHCSNRKPSVRSVEVGNLKNRMGPVGWIDQPLTFDAATQRWKA